MAMSKRQPLQVTVLILHIKALSAMSGHLMNIMQSALESYGVKVSEVPCNRSFDIDTGYLRASFSS